MGLHRFNYKRPLVEPTVSILIVNYNAGEYLQRCVSALKLQTFESFEALVIDNASSDDSLSQAITASDDDVRFKFLKMDRNLGFAAGNNHGAEQARAPWLATLNPDAFPEPDWLEQLIAATDALPDVAMFGSMQIDAANPDRLDGAGDRYFAGGVSWREQTPERYEAAQQNQRNTYPTFSPCAAAALYRTDAFRDVGGFDASFFCFMEDVDLAFRLRRAGHTCQQVVAARVTHVGGGAGGGKSDFARYHGTRNLIWCFFKNMPGPFGLLLAPLHIFLLFALMADAVLRGRGRPTWQGIRDGFRGLPAVFRARNNLQNKVKTGKVLSAMDWNPAAFLKHRARRR